MNPSIPKFTGIRAASLLSTPPKLNIQRIGLVSRHYNQDYGNGYPDFSASFRPVLKFLDDAGCDTVLFSLFSFIPRADFDVFAHLRLTHIQALCFEEFVLDAKGERHPGAYVVGVQNAFGWQQYRVHQVFSRLSNQSPLRLQQFVQDQFVHQRLLGNACLILCGESNGVKYVPAVKSVQDLFGLRQAIPENVSIVLNPVHDRMTRFEMLMKRCFLSAENRWVISVWNKGRLNKLGQTRDGKRPAWSVFHQEKAVIVPAIANPWAVEMGILDLRNATPF